MRGAIGTCLALVVFGLWGCGSSDGEASAGTVAPAAQEQAVAEAQESASGQEASARQVSYSSDVYPIFAAKCISCHHPTNAVEVILTDIFDPELGMINRPNTWKASSRPILVVPGDPDASALMLKIEETELELKVDGDPMPWAIPRLPSGELGTLRDWINDGAQNNAAFRGSIVRIFGDGVSLGSRGGRCAYCHHSDPGAYQPDLVDVFNPETGAVNVASYYGGLRIAPGDASSSVVYLRSSPTEIPPRLEPLMPQHYERLTPDELAAVREWIALGAQDN